jgi:hypothetical protein
MKKLNAVFCNHFLYVLQKQNVLIEEQEVNNPNPVWEMAQEVALHN